MSKDLEPETRLWAYGTSMESFAGSSRLVSFFRAGR
jgi:hypothetical protein